ncbi:hypothetical protein [Halocatena marina]|uniref:Uncharacterized protein n=1 Tax=Halocatena marina TaxID=2934937 RepID=A0ABD5YNN7_9EURY|nr:hypothetical protein [Halocatena marina]
MPVTTRRDQLEYHTDLRSGGWLGIDDDALVIVRESEEPLSVPLDDIAEVTAQDIDLFLVVMSVTLVGFGLWATSRNVVGGLVFATIGLGSLYLTYRKRNRLTISVAGRPKPLQYYPVDTESTYAAINDALHEGVSEHS